VALEAAFLHLVSAFDTMREALHSLALTAIEDRPQRDEVLLVERLGYIVEDLRGWALEGRTSAAWAHNAVTHPLDGHRAREALGEANKCFIQFEYQFLDRAASHETVGELAKFGRQRGGEWLSWSGSVVMALEGCREPLRALDEAILRAWQELSEQLGSGSLSVWNTNIGQQVGAPPERQPGRTPRKASGGHPRSDGSGGR
jgi:hypothetical protein